MWPPIIQYTFASATRSTRLYSSPKSTNLSHSRRPTARCAGFPAGGLNTRLYYGGGELSAAALVARINTRCRSGVIRLLINEGEWRPTKKKKKREKQRQKNNKNNESVRSHGEKHIRIAFPFARARLSSPSPALVVIHREYIIIIIIIIKHEPVVHSSRRRRHQTLLSIGYNYVISLLPLFTIFCKIVKYAIFFLVYWYYHYYNTYRRPRGGSL